MVLRRLRVWELRVESTKPYAETNRAKADRLKSAKAKAVQANAEKLKY